LRGDDKTVRVWDTDSGVELLVLRRHEGTVVSVSWSPDGRRIASASEQTVRVWDADNGAELALLRGHEDRLWGVSWSPDGRRIASASEQTVRVWDADSGAELAVLHGNEETAGDVSWSPDGRRIMSVSYARGAARVWDAENGHCLRIIEDKEGFEALVAGTSVFPVRALSIGGETVINLAATALPVTWLPSALYHIWPHPSDRTWAGSVLLHNHLYIFSLEGTIL
jgi:WD40 repeat protein